jgi:hypothetical protein
VIKDYERRNYIQAETIYNKLLHNRRSLGRGGKLITHISSTPELRRAARNVVVGIVLLFLWMRWLVPSPDGTTM